MADLRKQKRVAYGKSSALIKVPDAPFLADRAPTTADYANPGQPWVNKTGGEVYFNTDGSNNWITVAGGAGAFDSLTVTPGPTAITGAFTVTSGTENVSIGADAADHDVALGSATGASALTVQFGTGGGVISGAVTGAFTLGSATATADLTLGLSTAGQDINIGSGINAGAQIISIANGASAADTTVNLMSGVGTAGAGILNLANNTRVTTVDIGDISPAAARTFNIAGGDQAQNDTFNILGGNPSAGTQAFNVFTGTPTGGTQTVTVGNSTAGFETVVNVDSHNFKATPSVTGAQTTLTPTLSVRVGSILVDGSNATVRVDAAGAAPKTFVITNTLVSATSVVFISVSSVEAIANVKLEATAVQCAANALSVIIDNEGGSNTAGNYNINFWILS